MHAHTEWRLQDQQPSCGRKTCARFCAVLSLLLIVVTVDAVIVLAVMQESAPKLQEGGLVLRCAH